MSSEALLLSRKDYFWKESKNSELNCKGILLIRPIPVTEFYRILLAANFIMVHATMNHFSHIWEFIFVGKRIYET